jgi:hypothetical protein
MRAKLLLFAAAAALLLASSAFSTEKRVVKLVVTTVKQDSPVQVVGFKYPDRGPGYPQSEHDFDSLCRTGGYCPKVVLRNTTAPDVTSIVVDGLTGDPGKSEDGEGEYPHLAMGVLQVDSKMTAPRPVIAANAESEFGSSLLWPAQILGGALMHSGAVCIHVAVVVTRVEFSDGTTWYRDSKQNAEMWRDSVRGSGDGACQTSDEASRELKSFATWAHGPIPSHSTTDTMDSYTVSCPVRKIPSGEDAAVCTW